MSTIWRQLVLQVHVVEYILEIHLTSIIIIIIIIIIMVATLYCACMLLYAVICECIANCIMYMYSDLLEHYHLHNSNCPGH